MSLPRFTVAALVAGFFVVRALVRRAEQRRFESAERDAELARCAEQQHRWTLRGDSRGVYGPFPTPPTRSTNDPTLKFYRDTFTSQAARDQPFNAMNEVNTSLDPLLDQRMIKHRVGGLSAASG